MKSLTFSKGIFLAVLICCLLVKNAQGENGNATSIQPSATMMTTTYNMTTSSMVTTQTSTETTPTTTASMTSVSSLLVILGLGMYFAL